MARLKDRVWNMWGSDGGKSQSAEAIAVNVLMDLRDEMKRLNRLLHCHNIVRGFQALSKIAARDERTFKRRVATVARKRVARGR